MSRGGVRAGAGRPRKDAAPRKRRTFYLSEALPKLSSAEVAKLIGATGGRPLQLVVISSDMRVTLMLHDIEDTLRCAKAYLNNTELEVAGVTFKPGEFILIKH